MEYTIGDIKTKAPYKYALSINGDIHLFNDSKELRENYKELKNALISEGLFYYNLIMLKLSYDKKRRAIGKELKR